VAGIENLIIHSKKILQSIAAFNKWIAKFVRHKTQLVMKKLFVFALLVAGISTANAQEKKADKKENKTEKKDVKSATAHTEKKADVKANKAADKAGKAVQAK
jgi:hypothetical protein